MRVAHFPHITNETNEKAMGTKIQIVEDSKASWDLLKFKIESISEKKLEFLPYYATAEEAVGSFFLYRPEIVIADLRVLHSYDLDVIEKLFFQNMIRPKIIVLATTNQLENIQRVVEIGISALVMKPVNTENLARALRKVATLIDKDKEEEVVGHFINLRSNRSVLYLNQQDILFVESNRNLCTVTEKDGNLHTVNESISSIDQRLVSKDLLRIDKSTIINLSKIVYLGGDKYNKECRLKLDNGNEISKSLSKIAMNRLFKIVANNDMKKGQNVI